ncbi:hypothetical protein AXX17_ATUG02120 (chloroplast) [Arabidopsis thaliana]|uniref:Myosin heavy chain-like protein n=1 Tax=Arabidopsis thaliana TaxID=3702 RepID=A0A178U5U8_ARATH|nr:hypothetical protein AXX17_ATUG02120 [Arabidopsis thaliana]
MILPKPSLHPENVPARWCCAYANVFEKCGLFFPIPACILEMLYCLVLAFPQMCPNFVRQVLPIFIRAREVNREFGCHDLLQLCQVKNNARSDHGTYYISARLGSLVLGGLKACRDTNWRSKYFFFRVDHHSIGSFDPARMTRTWSTNLAKTKKVTLSETELELLTLLRRAALPDPIEEVPRSEADLPIVSPDSSSTSELPLIRRRMRRPSLRVQRANAGAPARAGDLSAAVSAARNTLAVSSASASPSHPSLTEIYTGTSTAAGQSDNIQVAQVSGPSAVVRSDGAPSSPKRAQTQPEVHPAAELVVSDQGVASPREERVEPAAANLGAATSADRRSSGRSHRGGRGSRGWGRSSNRSQEVRQTSNSGGGSAGSRPFHWSYTHDRDHPIVEDEAGLANLLHHIKGRNCQVPGVKNMAEVAAYADMMAKEGQAIAATNKLAVVYEQRLRQVPSVSELEEGKTLIQELTSSVKAGQEREVSFQAEIERLKMELSTSKDLEKGYAEKIRLMEMEIGGLQRREELSKRVELAAAYSKLLAGIKEKWVAKKEYTMLEGQAVEVESNLVLNDQITKAAIDLTVERPRLQAELDDLEAQCKSKEVSIFTLSKLDLPHVSEISVVRLMDVDEQGTPIGLDEFGSNKDAFPGGLTEGSSTVFATPAGELRE